MQRTLISLIAGVALAAVAIFLLTLYIRGLHSGQGPTKQAATGSIVLASVDMPFGMVLKPENLRVATWPRDSIPKGAFHSIADVFKGANGSSRIVLNPMVADEPVLKSKISGFGAKPTLSREVAPGMRAVSIRVNDVSGVSGFILPGDHVDVLLTRRLPGRNPENDMATDVILQDVVVLGIDQLSNQQHDKPVVARTATVQVTPEQAQKLALAEKAGTLSLALRNVATTGDVPTVRVETSDLAATVKRPHRNRGPGVRVIYGAGR